jgi:hypothetical protein
MIAALLALALPATTKWAVFIDVPPKPHFVDMTDNEAREALITAVGDRLSFDFNKHNLDCISSPSTRLSGHEDDKSAWQAIADQSGADHIALIHIEKWTQKNRSAEEITSSPNRGASETKVEIRMWTYDPKTGEISPPGRDKMTGVANSVYFGTTDKSDMQGGPDARALEVKNVNKKRMRAIGDAVFDAIKDRLN